MATSSWSNWPAGFTLQFERNFQDKFPLLQPVHCIGSFSAATRNYNCFAWAATENHQRWDPDPWGQYYWPPNIPRVLSLPAVIAAYKTVGYEECSDGTFEHGVEKIAIYTRFGIPKHAARQLENGNWTTKFGDLEDIEHVDLDCISGPQYGQVEKYMKRVRR
jgi:hypothetical protein